MKVSVLTPTYQRGNLLYKLYSTLLKNNYNDVDIEWLIMDDGSTDNTRTVINEFIKDNKIKIKYFFQNNQGKMEAINNLVGHANGDIIIECDSDDYFTKDAFKWIKESYDRIKNREDIYAICFLKYDQSGRNMGNLFKYNETTMFDLYFKENENGEKAIAFIGSVRKKYNHKIEKKEKFITEARMYHEIDFNYKIYCVNKPIMVCEYRNDGYSKNIKNQFKENPYGYYEYFKEIFEHDMKGVPFSKRLYVIKHYILFSYLTKSQKSFKNVCGILNKLLYIILYIPGIIKSKIEFGSKAN